MKLKQIVLFCLLAGILFQNTEAYAMGTDVNTTDIDTVEFTEESAKIEKDNTEENSNKKKKIIGYKYVYKRVPRKVKKKTYLGKYLITHYCTCSMCCGKSDGITASGKKARPGITVAADPSIPFGAKLKIGGKSGYVVEDRGGAIRGKYIDVLCSSHALALKKGRQYKKVWAESSFTMYEKKKVKVPIYE